MDDAEASRLARLQRKIINPNFPLNQAVELRAGQAAQSNDNHAGARARLKIQLLADPSDRFHPVLSGMRKRFLAWRAHAGDGEKQTIVRRNAVGPEIAFEPVPPVRLHRNRLPDPRKIDTAGSPSNFHARSNTGTRRLGSLAAVRRRGSASAVRPLTRRKLAKRQEACGECGTDASSARSAASASSRSPRSMWTPASSFQVVGSNGFKEAAR